MAWGGFGACQVLANSKQHHPAKETQALGPIHAGFYEKGEGGRGCAESSASLWRGREPGDEQLQPGAA